MERTKFPTYSKQAFSYRIEEEPIILSKHLLDLLFQDERPSEVIALYCFYYYTAKWQKTSQIKATTFYTCKGLKWSPDRVRAVKKRLETLGLISNTTKREEDSGQISAHHIQVNFIYYEPHPRVYPESGVGHTVENPREKDNILIYNKASVVQDNFITPNMFERFWKIYPRKSDKGKTYTAWCKVCIRRTDKVTWTQIKKAILAQIETERWQDPNFIPMPSTWLNQSRWLDDPSQMVVYRRVSTETKFWDGIRYTKGPDGYYRNKAGEVWIE